MVKISPPVINFKSSTGAKPSTGRGLGTSRTIPEITYHKTVKVWARLEESGSPLANGGKF
jgi:hypothetical protein